jgi:chorismate mutase/prephenate dehydratase
MGLRRRDKPGRGSSDARCGVELDRASLGQQDRSRDDGSRSEASERIARARREIDAIDDQILALLGQRAERNAEVGRLKRVTASEVFVPSRELDIYERLERQNRSSFPNSAIRSVFREIISASRALQADVRVAYLGPGGTYTHQAAIQQFGRMAEFFPTVTISEIFREVEAGRCTYGVVPVENSTEGVVSHTLDLLVDSPLTICAEIYQPIHHDLLSRESSLRAISAVYSHPQGLAQCRQWLELNLPHASQHPMHSTAHAAERVSQEPGAAAIASPVTRDLYDLSSLASSVEDNKDNTTRFLVVGAKPPARSDRDITTLLFSTRRDEAGTLHRALEPFAVNGVNLTRIESRPTKVRAWEYIFFCDFEGNIDDPAVARAIEGLRSRCEFLKVMGSYPRDEA